MDKKEDTLAKEIDALISKYSGSELWYETVRLAVKRNPRIAQEVSLTIKDNRALREDLTNQKYGLNQTKSMRYATRMPQSVDDLLCVVDPDTFPLNQHDKSKATKILMKMKKVLPEFFIPEAL